MQSSLLHYYWPEDENCREFSGRNPGSVPVILGNDWRRYFLALQAH